MRTHFLRRLSPFVFSASIVAIVPSEVQSQTFLERLEARLGQAAPSEEAAAEEAPAEETPPETPRVGRPGYLGLVGDDAGSDEGVVVTAVRENSPAARAGFQEGDRVVEVEGVAVENLDAMARQLQRRWVGTPLTFRIVRAGTEQTLRVVLGERPAVAGTLPAPADSVPAGPLLRSAEPAAPSAAAGSAAPDSAAPGSAALGVRLGAVTPALAQRYGFTAAEGAVIIGIVPGTPAERYRLPIGAVVVDVNGQAVRSVEDLQGLVEAAAPGDEWELSYFVRDQRYRTKVRLAPAGAPRVAPAPRSPLAEAAPRGLGSRLEGSGRRPLLGRIGRVLDDVLADAAVQDAVQGVLPEGDLPPDDVPADVLPPERSPTDPPPLPAGEAPPFGDEAGPDSEVSLLRDEVQLLRQEVELLRRRVEQLERDR